MGQYIKANYIIVAEDSPQYFWCEDRSRANLITKVDINFKSSYKKQNYLLAEDSYIGLSYLFQDNKINHSWSAIDSDFRRGLVNIFYAPPHISQVSLRCFQDVIYLKHISTELEPKVPKLESPYKPNVESETSCKIKYCRKRTISDNINDRIKIEEMKGYGPIFEGDDPDASFYEEEKSDYIIRKCDNCCAIGAIDLQNIIARYDMLSSNKSNIQ